MPIYGISQDPSTLCYIMVIQNEFCRNCGETYAIPQCKWCVPCQRNYLEKDLANWNSGNENIDKSFQEMQLRISNPDDIVFEWVPYNQFDDIEEISSGEFTKIYSATWKDGPLNYDNYEWKRLQNKKIELRCLCNSQNITKEFILDEV
jgi:hypothetical protein